MTATVVDRGRALRKAQGRRSDAADARRALRTGHLTLRQALESDSAATLRVYETLLLIPRCGEVKMRLIVGRAGQRTGARHSLGLKRLGELSSEQRSAIVLEARRALHGVRAAREVVA